MELPHNIEAEKCLLGAILVNNRAFESVSDFLKAEDFAIPEHGAIYDACKALIENNRDAGPVTLSEPLKEPLAAIGGDAYLAELMGAAITIINAPEYGRIIHDLAVKRELIYAAENIINQASKDCETSFILEDLERNLTTITDEGGHDVGTPESQIDATLEGLQAAYRGETPPGLETGLIDLDRILGRLRDGGLYIIAGRPAMGKSILGLNIAERVASEKPVMFFSLEMPATEIQERRICNKTEIDFSRLRCGEVSETEIKRAIEIGGRLKTKPLIVDDTGGITVEYVKRHARRQKRKTGLGLVAVDYIQLMSGERHGNREQEVSSITRALKALAKELRCPVVALSQINRGVEAREDKTPRMSDLRESGGIENDADVIMMLYREEYYLDQSKPVQREGEMLEKFQDRCSDHAGRTMEAKGLADIIIAKNRQGATGVVPVHFSGATMKFSNLAREINGISRVSTE